MKLKTLVAAAALLATTVSYAFTWNDDDHLVFGYYNNDITKDRPLQKATTAASRGFIVSYQGQAYSFLSGHVAIITGVSYSRWYYSRNDKVWDIALYPAVRVYLTRGNVLDPYVVISAGPSYIDRSHFGPANLGKQFIFQDNLGVGTVINTGESELDLSLKIYHYSNAGIFPPNNGFDVPMVLSLGYAF